MKRKIKYMNFYIKDMESFCLKSENAKVFDNFDKAWEFAGKFCDLYEDKVYLEELNFIKVGDNNETKN